MTAARILRIADRLGLVAAGSAEADAAIHVAVGRAGPALPYTTDQTAARTLLPPGYEASVLDQSVGRVYAVARARGEPHSGQWAADVPLAICGAALRAKLR